MEALFFTPTLGFVNVGERCNVTGSRRFAKLIKDGAFEQAVEVARDQAKAGAQIIDVNMDEAMLDGLTVMPKFLNLIGADPEVAKVFHTHSPTRCSVTWNDEINLTCQNVLPLYGCLCVCVCACACV
jgi:hypothetical protein